MNIWIFQVSETNFFQNIFEIQSAEQKFQLAL